jgi:hypothetical protein
MKASVVVLLACVLIPVLAQAQEGQAQGNLNTITSVSVRGGTVEIVGTKKPNFTTFTMTDPPRLVIDISEAVFSGVKDDLPVGNGTVTGIRTASYGSDESAIARVLIGYEREVETDIQATGNSLVVNVVGGGGATVAARPTAPAGTAGTGTAGTGTGGTTPGGTPEQAAVAAQADQKQQERAAAQATAAAQADQKQQERAAAQATAAAQADQKQQERAAAQAAAAAQADAEAQRQAQARAEADRKAQEESARVAAQQAEQQRLQQERAAKEASAAAEKQRREDEARAAAEAKKRQQAEAQAAAASSAEEKRRLAAEEKARREEAAQAAAEEKRRLAAEARARQQDEARQSRLAQAETPRRAPEQGDGLAVSSRRKTMMLVGFKQEPTASRVFIRTNEPVRYTVSEGNKQVVLELENTGISESNNTRSLDTSFFDTAVASVDADAGPSRTVRVAIKLKEQVTYQTRQDGNEVSIEFQRPARR